MTDISGAERVLTGIRQANRTVNALFAAFTREHGLTMHQVFMLRFLAHRHEPVTLNELADALKLPKSTASVDVDRMVRAGYLIRRTDPDCRRQVLIQLNPAGEELARAGPAAVIQRIGVALAAVPPEEREWIDRGLARLNEALAAVADPHEPTGPPFC